MIEIGEDLPFVAKAPNNEIDFHASPDQLNGNSPLEFVISPDREVDGPHSATADLSHHSICSDATADVSVIFRVNCSGQTSVGTHRLRLDEFAGVPVRCEQRFDFFPQ